MDEVKKSSINFGVAPLAGSRMSEIDPITLQNTIRTAIVSFEPRLIEESLSVKFVTEAFKLVIIQSFICHLGLLLFLFTIFLMIDRE